MVHPSIVVALIASFNLEHMEGVGVLGGRRGGSVG